MEIRPFEDGDEDAVVELWSRCRLLRPWNDPLRQRQGLGRSLMDEAERKLRDLGCPKINLQIRDDNLGAIAFYERIGFTEDAVVSLGKRLESDDV